MVWLCEGIVKTHRLLFIECDTVQAVFTKHLCPNVFTAQTRYMCQLEWARKWFVIDVQDDELTSCCGFIYEEL